VFFTPEKQKDLHRAWHGEGLAFLAEPGLAASWRTQPLPKQALLPLTGTTYYYIGRPW